MAWLVTREPIPQKEITIMVREELGEIAKVRYQKFNLCGIQAALTRKERRIEGLTLEDIRTAIIEIFKHETCFKKVYVCESNSHGECEVILEL